MLELLTAVVCLVVGMFVGVWMRRSALADYERGVALGFTQCANYVKSHQPNHQPRQDNQPRQNGPQEKK